MVMYSSGCERRESCTYCKTVNMYLDFFYLDKLVLISIINIINPWAGQCSSFWMVHFADVVVHVQMREIRLLNKYQRLS